MMFLLPVHLLFVAVFPSLTATLAPKPSFVLVRGHLDHAPAGDTVWLEYRPHLSRQAPHVRLDPAGNFEFVARDIAAPTHASVYYAGKRASLYLTPGDQLMFTTDYSRFREAARYDGQGANPNNYLAQAYAKFEYVAPGTSREDINSFDFVCESPAQERQKANALRQERQAFLAAYHRQHPLSNDFRAIAAAHIDLMWTRRILTFASDHPRLARTPQQAAVLGHSDTSIQLPTTYFNFLRDLPLGTLAVPSETVNRGYDDSNLVLECLGLYADNLLPGSARSPEQATLENMYAQASKDLGLTPARDYAVATMLFDKQVRIDPAWVVAAYPVFRAHNRDSVASRYMRQLVRKQVLP
ncbi:hypothetical protein [Hymenobacter sp. GOD-10R]|uniref:hypothetical protein n=1 Tax=Hymenobacter sp. GOD-10R TaxID=3093922 RepID=UPI002D77E4F3|nr:hypothetical protein [Hymenobacter sp. GOD-10R]WRQ28546.1 hypothetical protein SD425_26110 [Hymenobacter sp. GOD-10R]